MPRTVSDSFVPLQTNLQIHKTKSLDKNVAGSNPRFKEAPPPAMQGMARTSSRADEENFQMLHNAQRPNTKGLKEEDLKLSSGESLSENIDQNAFPPPPGS